MHSIYAGVCLKTTYCPTDCKAVPFNGHLQGAMITTVNSEKGLGTASHRDHVVSYGSNQKIKIDRIFVKDYQKKEQKHQKE